MQCRLQLNRILWGYAVRGQYMFFPEKDILSADRRTAHGPAHGPAARKGENMNQTTGKSSIRLEKKVYILNSASIVGKKEGEGPLGNLFDMVGEDDLFGCDTWEEAESNLQKDAVYMALGKAGKTAEDIRYLFAGDLLGQSIATSFGLASHQIPLLGVYGACSTCGESLTLGAMAVSAGYADYVASRWRGW